MRLIFTIFLLLISVSSLSHGQDDGCSKQKFKDAELAAYRALLQSRAEAARILAEEISSIEGRYKEKLSRFNRNYLRDLNNCGNNSACTETAKSDNDKWVGMAQVDHDGALYIAQGKELTAKDQAQENYDAEVKKAKQLYCVLGYRATGQTGDMVYSGVICSLEKPFIVSGSIINYSFQFTPSSATTGTTTISAAGMMVIGEGGGFYKIEGADTDKLRIALTATVVGHSPVGSRSGGGTVYIDLVPLDTDECN